MVTWKMLCYVYYTGLYLDTTEILMCYSCTQSHSNSICAAIHIAVHRCIMIGLFAEEEHLDTCTVNPIYILYAELTKKPFLSLT